MRAFRTDWAWRLITVLSLALGAGAARGAGEGLTLRSPSAVSRRGRDITDRTLTAAAFTLPRTARTASAAFGPGAPAMVLVPQWFLDEKPARPFFIRLLIGCAATAALTLLTLWHHRADEPRTGRAMAVGLRR